MHRTRAWVSAESSFTGRALEGVSFLVDDRETCEAVLAYARGLESPTAASVVEGYARLHPGINSGSVRLALMRLLDRGEVSIDRDWRLRVRVS